jgi:hypothetical protein
MKILGMKNLVLPILLACFFHSGQKFCLDQPQGGGVDTGNPKGEPTNDPTKPVYMERRLEEMQLTLPGMLMGDGGHELGPKIMKS